MGNKCYSLEWAVGISAYELSVGSAKIGVIVLFPDWSECKIKIEID